MSSCTTTRRATADKPATLLAQATAAEEIRHAGRMAAIKRMTSRLAQLDAFMPALIAAGVAPHADEISDWGGRRVWLGASLCTPDVTRGARIANVLLASGMKVEEREDYDYGHRDVTLTLKKGHLQVAINIDGRGKHLLEVPACK